MESPSVENELNVPLLVSRLWRGKGWIIGLAAAGLLLAFGYAQWATQVWSATAIVDHPSVSQIAPYYTQRQLLATLEDSNAPPPAASSVTDEAYQEFLLQLSSWDSRRDFWLQSQYFRRQLTGHEAQRAVILNKLIGNIRLQAAEPVRGTRDTLILLADNAADSARLLSQYVQFASQRAIRSLNSNLSEEWRNAWQLRQTELIRQKVAVDALQSQAADSDGGSDKGGAALASGYLQNKALLENLRPAPALSDDIQTWRYLRSPEPPVSPESPRLLLLMALWGMTGVFIGAVIAIARR
ncbi:Wzz/FepE/Etk N-terminal domain-containing protein [Tatumella sp. UBA2305]|uniref:Wzz/FepE/Etk N-terminal domain-containing protein n=1 Tax=Tatumella sp. UBA2305 TaxID=1947647 RepID=UPI0025FA6187|nr:Wzz/FepE/Etk N-terminal domain-containing protein [Tatumella sp. UBA2305]